MSYAFLARSRVTMVRSRGKTFSVFTRDDIAVLTATTCAHTNAAHVAGSAHSLDSTFGIAV